MAHLRQPVSPSAFLPPLKQLHSCSAGTLSLGLQALNYLYQPDRPIFPIPNSPTVDSGYASDDEGSRGNPTFPPINAQWGEELKESWRLARADPLERDFAVRWMTGFLARGLEWVTEAEKIDEMELEDREAVYEGFSTLLSSCAKASEAGAILREFTFPKQNLADGQEIKIVLVDEDLSSTDHTSVGLQTWGSAFVMAERIVKSPHLYGILNRGTQAERNTIRILELGAGTGLLSLVVQKLLVHMGVSAQIVATDCHPAVLANLERNIAASNVSVGALDGISVSMTVAPLDWELFQQASSNDEPTLDTPFDQRFDVILGADVVYQSQHAQWLAGVAHKLLKKPDYSDDTNNYPPVFHLIAANRATREKTYTSIHEAFPSFDAYDHSANLQASSSDQLSLCIIDSADLAHVKGVGRADESGYREYRIEWR